jgi:hypothetical protein
MRNFEPLLVTGRNAAGAGAGLAIEAVDHLSADCAGDGMNAQFPTGFALVMSFAVDQHRFATPDAGLTCSSRVVASEFDFVSAFRRAATAVIRCVTTERFVARFTDAFDLTNEPSRKIDGTDLVCQRSRQERTDQFSGLLNGNRGDANMRVLIAFTNRGVQPEPLPKKFSEPMVLANREPFRCNGDAGSVPAAIVTNETGQGDGVSDEVEVSLADDLDAIPAIEHRREFRQLRNRPGVKPTAHPRLPVSLICLGAPLDRARYGRKPSVLLFEPFTLADGVIAG